MFIIFSGEVGIYLSKDTQKIGSRGRKEVFGETALDTNMPRSAYVKAEDFTITFILKKADYERILLNIKKLEKHETTKFLMSINIFSK